MEKEGAPGQLGINSNFTITNLEGKELIFMAFTQRPEYQNGYKTGKTLTYYVIEFVESGKTSKKQGTLKSSGAAKLIAKNKLIVDGQIDPRAEEKFHLKYWGIDMAFRKRSLFIIIYLEEFNSPNVAS